MQRTRDKVWLHGKALGREPLIAIVRQQEVQSQSQLCVTPKPAQEPPRDSRSQTPTLESGRAATTVAASCAVVPSVFAVI